jgi:crossover junction endodeoxyribonuclease RuvC
MWVIGIDPGLAKCGWAVIRKEKGVTSLRDAGVISTEPGPMRDRIEYLVDTLKLRQRGPFFVSMESMSYPRSAKAAAMLSASIAVVLTSARLAGLSVTTITPRDLRRGLGLAARTDKTAIEAAVRALIAPAEFKDCIESIPRTIRNHAVDAVGIAIVGAKNQL